MNWFRLLILLTCFLRSINFLAAETPVFFESNLIIPKKYRSQFEDLADPQLRYVPSTRAYLIPYDSLAGLTTSQLFIVFFEIPDDFASRWDQLAFLKQQQALKALLHLPYMRIAELLTHENLNLDSHFKDRRVSRSQADLAKYYALSFLIQRERDFLNALMYLALDPISSNPLRRAWQLLELIRDVHQVAPGRGLDLEGILRLLDRLPLQAGIRLQERGYSGELAKEFLIRKVHQSMELPAEPISSQEIFAFKEIMREELIYSKRSDFSGLPSRGERSHEWRALRVSDGEYIVTENSSAAGIQIVPSSQASVIGIFRSRNHTLAMIFDVGAHPEDSLYRIFERLKLRKIKTSGMTAMIFGGSVGVSDQLVFRIKRWLSSNGRRFKLDEEASEYLGSRKIDGIFFDGNLSLILGVPARANFLLRNPADREVLLRTHPRSLDFGDFFGKPRIPLPKDGSLSQYDRNGDKMIGQDDLLLCTLTELRKLFNPSDEDLKSFPKDAAASLLMDLPYWVIAEVLSQKFSGDRNELLHLYVDSLRSYDSQKLEQIILYLAPQEQRFANLGRHRILGQIFNNMSLEEREDFLGRLERGLNPAFGHYIEALTNSFVYSEMRDTGEASSDQNSSQELVVVEDSDRTEALPDEDSLELKAENIQSKEFRPDFSYIPAVYAGSWRYSSRPISEKEVAAFKLMMEKDSIVVSVFDLSKNLMAAIHLKAGITRMETHKMIDHFLDSLIEAGFSLRDSNVHIIVANQLAVQKAGSRTTLDRVQKRFLLYGFKSVDSMTLNMEIDSDWVPVLWDLRSESIFRLRKARIFEFRSALRVEREPGLTTIKAISMAGENSANQSLYGREIRSRCEHALSQFAKSRVRVKKELQRQLQN